LTKKPEMAVGFIVRTQEYFILLDDMIDKEAEIEKLEKELKYAEGFLMSVNKKLSNEKFVANAPEKVIAMERKKLSDAEAKISILKEQIEILKK